MNSDVTTTTQAWAYVHGELSAEERAAYERSLADDPEARAALAEIRALDGRLRRLAPCLAEGDDALVARCIEDWETQTGDFSGCGRHGGRPSKEEDNRSSSIPEGRPLYRPLDERDSRKNLWPRFVYAGAALAAAALFLIVVLPRQFGGPIRWDEPVFTPLQYRGAGPATVSRHTAREAMACFDQLKDEVNRSYKTGQSGQRRFFRCFEAPAWRLSFSFRDLANGSFSVGVEARGANGEQVGEWTREFDGLREFQAGSHVFGLEIADDLGNIRGAGSEGQP